MDDSSDESMREREDDPMSQASVNMVSIQYCDYCHKRGHNVKTCWVKQRARMEMAEQFLGEMSIAIKVCFT